MIVFGEHFIKLARGKNMSTFDNQVNIAAAQQAARHQAKQIAGGRTNLPETTLEHIELGTDILADAVEKTPLSNRAKNKLHFAISMPYNVAATLGRVNYRELGEALKYFFSPFSPSSSALNDIYLSGQHIVPQSRIEVLRQACSNLYENYQENRRENRLDDAVRRTYETTEQTAERKIAKVGEFLDGGPNAMLFKSLALLVEPLPNSIKNPVKSFAHNSTKKVLGAVLGATTSKVEKLDDEHKYRLAQLLRAGLCIDLQEGNKALAQLDVSIRKQVADRLNTEIKEFNANSKEQLINTNLANKNLSHFNFDEIDLSGANLQGANCEGASFKGAKLDGADIRGATGMNLTREQRFSTVTYERMLDDQEMIKIEREIAADPSRPEGYRG